MINFDDITREKIKCQGSIEECNLKTECKILIVFDDMVANMPSNK